ncbi:MAG: phage major capsid family protein [Lysobacterales bacterium]
MDPLAQAAIRRAQAALTIANGPSREGPARDFVRSLLAFTLARSAGEQSYAYARNRWGADFVTRSGIAASDASDMAVSNSSSDAFFGLVLEASIVGQLRNARRVAFNTRTLVPGTGATGYWVGEKQPVPVSRYALTGESLPTRKTAGLVILTKESLEDPASEDRVFEDLLRAVTGVFDQAFVDDAAGSASTPAGILQGVSATASSGNPATDIAALIEGFSGDLSTSAVITDPTTAAMLGLHGGTAFQNAGAAGGSVLGVPLIASRGSPRDSSGGQLVLLDQSALALGLEGIEVKQSTAATIEADDSPTGEGSGPTAQSVSAVSLFQADLVAFLAVIFGNWRLTRTGAVAAISGADYSGAS